MNDIKKDIILCEASVAAFHLSWNLEPPRKEQENKSENENHSTQDSRVVPHRGTN